MTARYYVDTSAYLALLLGEDGSRELTRELAGSQLLASSLLVLEAGRNLIRLSRQGLLSPRDLQACMDRLDQDVESFLLRDLTLDLCRDQAMPVVSTPRTLDLIHLRTALWFHAQEPLTRFVSLDAGQNQAARELRLPV